MEEKWRIRQRILSAKLPSAYRLVGVAILEFRNRSTAACYPSHATIAEFCSMSVPTVKRAIAAMRAYGLVETERAGRSCSYSFPSSVPASCSIGISSSPDELSDRSPDELSRVQQDSIFRTGVGENLEEER